jgi:hypothetical protein
VKNSTMNNIYSELLSKFFAELGRAIFLTTAIGGPLLVAAFVGIGILIGKYFF